MVFSPCAEAANLHALMTAMSSVHRPFSCLGGACRPCFIYVPPCCGQLNCSFVHPPMSPDHRLPAVSASTCSSSAGPRLRHYTGCPGSQPRQPHRATSSRAGKAEGTKYTAEQLPAGVVTKGGSSWTKDWLKFDNSYFTEVLCCCITPLLTPTKPPSLSSTEGPATVSLPGVQRPVLWLRRNDYGSNDGAVAPSIVTHVHPTAALPVQTWSNSTKARLCWQPD